jgi:hypothetical protein
MDSCPDIRHKALQNLRSPSDKLEFSELKSDNIDMTMFNNLPSIQDIKEYTINWYNSKGKILGVYKSLYSCNSDKLVTVTSYMNVDQYVDHISEQVNHISEQVDNIENKRKLMSIISDTIDRCSDNKNRQDQIKLIYLLYDRVLPSFYRYIEKGSKLLITAINKLDSLKNISPENFSDIHKRRAEELMALK